MHILYICVCVCICVCAWVRAYARTRARVRSCVSVCARAYVCLSVCASVILPSVRLSVSKCTQAWFVYMCVYAFVSVCDCALMRERDCTRALVSACGNINPRNWVTEPSYCFQIMAHRWLRGLKGVTAVSCRQRCQRSTISEKRKKS